MPADRFDEVGRKTPVRQQRHRHLRGGDAKGPFLPLRHGGPFGLARINLAGRDPVDDHAAQRPEQARRIGETGIAARRQGENLGRGSGGDGVLPEPARLQLVGPQIALAGLMRRREADQAKNFVKAHAAHGPLERVVALAQTEQHAVAQPDHVKRQRRVETHEVHDLFHLGARVLEQGTESAEGGGGGGEFAAEGEDGLAGDRHGIVRVAHVPFIGPTRPTTKQNRTRHRFPGAFPCPVATGSGRNARRRAAAPQKSIALSVPIWTSKRSP